MDREEKLGRALMDVYSGRIVWRWTKSQSQYRFCVRFFDNESLEFCFRNWHEFLFGCKYRSIPVSKEECESANFYLKQFTQYVSYINLIEFSSLDELEIQLTLMGRNPM